jgi:hypothetical protein
MKQRCIDGPGSSQATVICRAGSLELLDGWSLLCKCYAFGDDRYANRRGR